MDATPERRSAATHRTTFAIAKDARDVRRSPRRSSKPKKPPPITPRRFTKFFTPRLLDGRHHVRASRAALQDITHPALNRTKLVPISESREPASGSPRKRRRLSFSSPTSSLHSSPLRKTCVSLNSQERCGEDFQGRGEDAFDASDVGEEDETDIEFERTCQKPVVRKYQSSTTSHGYLSWRLTGRRPQRDVENSREWQHSAADFCTRPEDRCTISNLSDDPIMLPFCTTSCNTNSLVAIGKEDGSIHIVDSALGDKTGFATAYLTMKPHDNAIMDLDFSADDALLATASGDQTCQVIDMPTQQSVYCLSGHSSSAKRVRFQPGSGNNVLASCSRDGSINIWDLRCRTVDRPSFHLRSAGGADSTTQETRYASVVNNIRDAHGLPSQRSKRSDRRSEQASWSVTSRNEFSVTSLSFLGSSRPHLLVSASEVNAVVNLWDMRTTYSSRRGRPVPMSCTEAPESHKKHRPFGLTDLVLSGDESRFYSLCRDHTVYAYSTSHLITGAAPELSSFSTRHHRPSEIPMQGLGPLFGLRHPSLRISTFYPKLAVRRPRGRDAELLAVGSSENCALVFSTDERYLTKSAQTPPATVKESRPPLLRRQSSFTASLAQMSRPDSDLPIYYHGTALVRGHNKEVTAVAYTSEGSLVTCSDDFSVRCWREDEAKARALRTGGEGEGRRWGCGWADVPQDFDDDDGDE